MIDTLAVIQADNFLAAWPDHSRQGWASPLVIRDGPHDYVLMSRPEYEKLAQADALLADLSPEQRETIAAADLIGALRQFVTDMTDEDRAEVNRLMAYLQARNVI